MSEWATVKVSSSEIVQREGYAKEITLSGPSVTGEIYIELGLTKIAVSHQDMATAMRRLSPNLPNKDL